MSSTAKKCGEDHYSMRRPTTFTWGNRENIIACTFPSKNWRTIPMWRRTGRVIIDHHCTRTIIASCTPIIRLVSLLWTPWISLALLLRSLCSRKSKQVYQWLMEQIYRKPISIYKIKPSTWHSLSSTHYYQYRSRSQLVQVLGKVKLTRTCHNYKNRMKRWTSLWDPNPLSSIEDLK
jgi:hypothetical protein